MTKVFTIIAVLFSTIVYGQVSKDIYSNVKGLTVVDSIAWTDIAGGFCLSDGYGGYNYRLDSNMSFEKIDFSCMAKFRVDSGSWSIQNHNTVVLNSDKQTLRFDILKFDRFYFFILPTERHKFIKDLDKTRQLFRNAKPLRVDSTTYSIEFMIGHTLSKKYYAKEIDDSTGT